MGQHDTIIVEGWNSLKHYKLKAASICGFNAVTNWGCNLFSWECWPCTAPEVILFTTYEKFLVKSKYIKLNCSLNYSLRKKKKKKRKEMDILNQL